MAKRCNITVINFLVCFQAGITGLCCSIRGAYTKYLTAALSLANLICRQARLCTGRQHCIGPFVICTFILFTDLLQVVANGVCQLLITYSTILSLVTGSFCAGSMGAVCAQLRNHYMISNCYTADITYNLICYTGCRTCCSSTGSSCLIAMSTILCGNIGHDLQIAGGSILTRLAVINSKQLIVAVTIVVQSRNNLCALVSKRFSVLGVDCLQRGTARLGRYQAYGLCIDSSAIRAVFCAGRQINLYVTIALNGKITGIAQTRSGCTGQAQANNIIGSDGKLRIHNGHIIVLADIYRRINAGSFCDRTGKLTVFDSHIMFILTNNQTGIATVAAGGL